MVLHLISYFHNFSISRPRLDLTSKSSAPSHLVFLSPKIILSLRRSPMLRHVLPRLASPSYLLRTTVRTPRVQMSAAAPTEVGVAPPTQVEDTIFGKIVRGVRSWLLFLFVCDQIDLYLSHICACALSP